MKSSPETNPTKTTEAFVHALREKDEMFRFLIESSKDGISLTDANGITLYASPATYEILGYSENEIFGRPGGEYLHPEDVMRVKALFESFPPGKSISYEARLRHKDGSYRWIDITTTNLLHVQGIGGIISNFRDITKRKEHECTAALRERELWNLANAIPQLAWIAEADGSVIFYNERISEYAGAVRNEATWNWNPLVHPEEIGETEHAWREAVKNKTVYSIEHRIKMKNGGYRFHLSRAFPHLNDQGEVLNWFGTATDIHEQKLAQQLLEQYASDLAREVTERTDQYKRQKDFAEAILDASVDIVAVYDTESRLVMANRNFFERFNLNKEDATGKKLLDIFPGGNEGLERLQKAFKGEVAFYPALKSKFSEGYFESNIIPVRDAHERVYAVLVIAHDVTKSIQATEMLRQSAEQLQSANESLIKQNEELEQFAYIASHDLQEPLRKITTFARMLERVLETNPEDSERYIQKIIQSSNRMSELIRDVLKFSRLNTVDSLEYVDLNHILANILNDLELLIEQRAAVIDRDTLPVIQAVPRQMTQLFYNLISNSLKFSHTEKEVRIRISCSKADPSEHDNRNLNYFRITFADNGIGFNQAYADKIFMMFQRLNTRDQYAGSGIGLAMVRKIISNHRGRIVAESEEGNGAAFHVILPERQHE